MVRSHINTLASGLFFPKTHGFHPGSLEANHINHGSQDKEDEKDLKVRALIQSVQAWLDRDPVGFSIAEKDIPSGYLT